MAKNSPANARDKRLRFNSWVRKIPWRRKWQPIPVFLPEESHGQRWTTVSRFANCRTQLKWLSTHALLKNFKFGVVLFCFLLRDFFFLLVVKFCACYWNINNIASVCLEAGFHAYTHSAHARLQAACFLHQYVHFRRDPDTHPPVSPWEPGQTVRCCMWIISQENQKTFLKKKGNWPDIYNW